MIESAIILVFALIGASVVGFCAGWMINAAVHKVWRKYRGN